MKCLRLLVLCFLSSLAGLTAPAFAQTAPWAGFYSGLSLGYVAGQTKWNTQYGDNVCDTVSPTIFIMDATSRQNFRSSDPHVSLFFGYNWQKDKIIYGIEADVTALNSVSSRAFIPGLFDCPVSSGLICDNYSTAGDRTSVRLGWNGSVRARLGLLVTPETLLYATTGLAIAGVDVAQTCQFSFADPACAAVPRSPLATTTNHKQLYGFVIGAGVERQIDADWNIRADYLYTTYGHGNVHSLLTTSVYDFSGTTNLSSRLGVSTHRLSLGLVRHF